jgi:hypothetical protein
MTTKTRYFLVGGTAVLALGLAGGLIAYFGVPTVGALTGEPAELAYVPEDATVVAFADVRQVMDSELRQQLLQMLPDEAGSAQAEGRQRFLDTTGIDLEQDVEHVVAYLLPDADEGGMDDGLVLVRGRFDQPRIEQLLTEHGGVAETYRGKRLIVRRFDVPPLPVPSPTPESPTQNLDFPIPNPEFALGFMQPGLVGVGTRSALVRAVDLESGGGVDITRNDRFMVLVRDAEGSDAWAVGRFDRLVDRANVPQEVTDRLPPITYFAASGQVNGGLSGRIRAEARDEESAQQLNEVVRGFVALAKLQSASVPQLTTILDSLQLQSDGTGVVLSFTVPAEALQELIQALPDGPPQ